MRFVTIPSLLALALFSAVVVVPFMPAARPDAFALEVIVRSAIPGVAKVYYDRGDGFTEAQSAQADYPGNNTPTLCRLPLPAGEFATLRVDPSDRDQPVIIEAARIAGPRGRVVRPLALTELQPVNEIARAEMRSGQLEITPATGAKDPQLAVTFAPPLELGWVPAEYVATLLPRALGVFAGAVALLLLLGRVPVVRRRAAATIAWAGARPQRAVAVLAALAVITSAYPVVFLGKSYVSPNLGTTLLYDAYPTLPGPADGLTVDVKGSDVGAIMWQHVPFSMVQHRALARGELPLWNRYNALGVPLLAQGQSMFGDPLHFIVIAANGRAWAWDLKYLIAKWVFATGLGLIVLALLGDQGTSIDAPISPGGSMSGPLVPSSLGLLAPALLVSAAAPFLGFFVYRINHPAFFSMCYAPWPLYAWLRIAQARNRRAITAWLAALMVANLALMNSGTVKEAYMLLASMNFSGAGVLLAAGTPWRERLAKFAAVAWAGILFLLLTAPIWATFLTTLKQAYTGYNAPSAFQIQPALLLGAFDEIFYRPIMAEQRTFNPSANFLILCGLLYFLATLRTQFANRIVITVAATSLVPLALAFGLVPAAWIVRVPFLANIAHLDNTFSCALIILWSVLAGAGFAQAAARIGRREGRGDLAIAALLLFGLVFAWIGFRQAGHRSIFGAGTTFVPVAAERPLPVSDFIWGYLASLLVAALLLAATWRRAAQRGGFTAALAVVAGLSVILMLWRQGFHVPSTRFPDYVVRPATRADFHARSEAIETMRASQRAEPSRGHALQGTFFAGWTAAYGLESIHGPDALVNPWVRELVGLMPGIERIWDWRLYLEPKNVAAARPFLDALNVRYYFDQTSERAALNAALRLVKHADLDVYESASFWPRAFFTDRLAVYAGPADFVRQIKSGDGRAFAAVQQSELAQRPALHPLPHDLAGRTVTPAQNYRLTENTTAFTVRATGPGVIVLAEAYWPGDFRVEVNGTKVPVLRLNHAFKGIQVDAAGEYRVIFRYWPRNFPRHLALAGIGTLLLAGSLVVGLRRPPRSAGIRPGLQAAPNPAVLNR